MVSAAVIAASACEQGATQDISRIEKRHDALVGDLGLIKDINPGGDSNPAGFTELGNKAYVVATDGTTGREIWSTDGTAAGTALVADLNPSGDSNPGPILANGAKTPFLGTVAWTGATYEIVRIKPGVSTEKWPLSANESAIGGVVAGDHVFILTRDATAVPELWRLWAFDDTSAPVELGRNLGVVGAVGDHAYFPCNSGGDLCSSDGTVAGTTVVAPGFGGFTEMVSFNNKAYFAASAGTEGYEIHIYDPSNGSVTPFDMYLGWNTPFPGYPEVPLGEEVKPTLRPTTGNYIYFIARMDHMAAGTPELWKLDKLGSYGPVTTASGAHVTAPQNLTSAGDFLYCTSGGEVYRVDANGVAMMLRDASGNPATSPSNFVAAGSAVLFRSGAWNTGEIWRADARGLAKVGSYTSPTRDGEPQLLGHFTNRGWVLVAASNPTVGIELFYVDMRTPWGVHDGAGQPVQVLSNIVVVNNGTTNIAYFATPNGVGKLNTDGTVEYLDPAATNVTTVEADSSDATTYVYYFSGSQLRRINPTTKAVDVITIPSATAPHDLEARRNDVFFIANDGTADVPYKVTSTATTATKLTFPTGNNYKLPHYFRGSAKPADRVFFIGTDGSGVEETYMFNALNSTVTRVPFNLPGTGSYPTDFVAVSRAPYMFINAYIDDPIYDYELTEVTAVPNAAPTVLSQTPYVTRPAEGSVRPALFPSSANDEIAFWTIGSQEVAMVDFTNNNQVTTASASSGTCTQPDHFVGLSTNDLYFSANTGGVQEVCHWNTLGSTYNRLPRINSTGNAGARVLGQAGGTRLYIAADDGIAGNELVYFDQSANKWVTNLDLVPGPSGSNPDQFTAVSGGWVFTATSGTSGNWLWFSDNL
jgi:ELWxxDGT repeat protein